ncbi:AraC family transcriptional regulator [Paenibacillus sp. strain BS8-2]
MTNQPIHESYNLELHQLERAYYPSLNVQMPRTAYWIVSYILEGEVTVTTPLERSIAKQGDVMIHPPGIAFSEESSTSGIHLWMMFHAKNAFRIDLLSQYPVPRILTLSDKQHYQALFAKLDEAWNNKSLSYRDLIAAGFHAQLLACILDSWQAAGMPSRPQNATEDDRLQTIIHFLLAHYESKITREQLAELVHLHPVHLDRIFQQTFGSTPIQMLREIRLRNVKQHLESTSLPLSEIAINCGFGDSAYLNRSFHKAFGITPGQYRSTAQLQTSMYRQNTDQKQ